jgi:hypothetical protein
MNYLIFTTYLKISLKKPKYTIINEIQYLMSRDRSNKLVEIQKDEKCDRVYHIRR